MFAFGKKHVVRLTPKLDQQGYQGDIELGEVIAETIVDSPEACGMLCEEHSACSSVMLTEQLCMLFSLSSPNCKVLDISCFAPFKISLGHQTFTIRSRNFKNFTGYGLTNTFVYNCCYILINLS